MNGHRSFWLLVTVVTLTICGLSMAGDQGVLRILSLRRDIQRIILRNEEVVHANRELRAQIERLRHDHWAVEKLAREQLGMVAPYEVVYRLRD